MNNKKTPPRSTPCRDDFYAGLTLWFASKSKDPKTQCGALIISPKNIPLGWGYNGPPAQIKDEDINWARPDKHPFISHAEDNAITYSRGSDLTGSTLYVSAMPCNACMLTIVKHGISRVVYLPFTTNSADPGSMLSDPKIIAKTKEIAQLGNVRLEPFYGNLNWMRDRMLFMESQGCFDSRPF